MRCDNLKSNKFITAIRNLVFNGAISVPFVMMFCEIPIRRCKQKCWQFFKCKINHSSITSYRILLEMTPGLLIFLRHDLFEFLHGRANVMTGLCDFLCNNLNSSDACPSKDSGILYGIWIGYFDQIVQGRPHKTSKGARMGLRPAFPYREASFGLRFATTKTARDGTTPN